MGKNKKQRRVMFLLILILGITIGFALLSTTLFINGTASIKSNTWNIHWDSDSVNVTTGSVSATEPSVSTTTSNDDTVSFDVELELPGDYFEFTIDAVNEGSIDGALDLSENFITYKSNNVETTLPEYMDFKVTYDDDTTPVSGNVLKANESKTYKIRVEYKSGIEDLPDNPQPIDIEVEIPYVQHKTTGIKYDLGDVVYFDPVSEDKCDSTTFDLTAVKNHTSTCYKWRVMTYDDTTSKTKVDIQLDHNLLTVDYVSSSISIEGHTRGEAGPVTALSALSSLTRDWTRLPLLNYTYDVSDIGSSNYGSMTCVDGTCNFSLGAFVNNLRVRLVTADELNDIAKSIQPPLVSNNSNFPALPAWTRQADEDQFYYSSQNYLNSNELSWLAENTSYDSDADATSGASTYDSSSSYGYWTLTPSKQNNDDHAWVVYYSGKLYPVLVYNTYNHYGIRPFTEVNKSMITKE